MSLKHSLIADSKRIHILKYVLLPSIALLVIVFLSTIPNLWTISAIDHYYIELFGTILAGILAFYYLSRSHNLKGKFSLFIGIGFLVNVLIDLLHVTVSFLNIDDILFLKYFIPQTWFAGRLFLSAMLAIVMIKYVSLSYDNPDIQKIKQKQTPSNQNHVNKISKKFLLYLIILASFSLIVAISDLLHDSLLLTYLANLL